MKPLNLTLAALCVASLLACGSTTEAVRHDKTVQADPPAAEVEIESSVAEPCGLSTEFSASSCPRRPGPVSTTNANAARAR